MNLTLYCRERGTSCLPCCHDRQTNHTISLTTLNLSSGSSSFLLSVTSNIKATSICKFSSNAEKSLIKKPGSPLSAVTGSIRGFRTLRRHSSASRCRISLIPFVTFITNTTPSSPTTMRTKSLNPTRPKYAAMCTPYFRISTTSSTTPMPIGLARKSTTLPRTLNKILVESSRFTGSLPTNSYVRSRPLILNRGARLQEHPRSENAEALKTTMKIHGNASRLLATARDDDDAPSNLQPIRAHSRRRTPVAFAPTDRTLRPRTRR